ncbi:MAG: histidine kinase [Lachnospiraceae bacterium]|nr:histidine kinase [Lachnospiraceae bacterium]
MIGEKNVIYAMLTDGAGIIILFLMMIPMVPVMTSRREVGKGIVYIFNASIAYSVVLFLNFGTGIQNLMGILQKPSQTGVLMAEGLKVIAAYYQVKYTFMDKDGAFRVVHRQSPVSVGCVAANIIPLVVAIGMDAIFPEFSFFGLAHAVTISVFYLIYRSREEKRLDEEARAIAMERSRFLADQMRPHFIFNALMCIEDLCYTDPEMAAKRLEDFSGFLRGNLEAMTSGDKIPFSIEMEHIRQYIMLERVGSSYEFEVKEDLQATDFSIPPLTIQPIVENAVRHGALGRRDHNGRVSIHTEQIGRFVRITVEDNGNGEEDLTSNQKQHKGVALENVKKRIALYDGTIKEETGDKGTRVVITLPVNAI